MSSSSPVVLDTLISFADSFVAATAQRIGAVLLHKDPEFNAVSGVVKLRMLPPKTGQSA